jgi:hypothetical protein
VGYLSRSEIVIGDSLIIFYVFKTFIVLLR